MAAIAAERIARHLERAGFVFMKTARAIRRSVGDSKASGTNLTLGGPPDRVPRSPGIDPERAFRSALRTGGKHEKAVFGRKGVASVRP
jgi:hypothetical protein